MQRTSFRAPRPAEVTPLDRPIDPVAECRPAVLLGVLVVLTTLGGPLGLRALPAGYLLWLAVPLPAYGIAAHLAKALGSRSRSAWR